MAVMDFQPGYTYQENDTTIIHLFQKWFLLASPMSYTLALF